MEMINYDDFKKVELRMGDIVSAERVDGSEKLIKLRIDDGMPNGRQIIAGIGKKYEAEELVGRRVVFVANLEPRKLMGLESDGMIVAAHDNEGLPVLLCPDGDVPPGSVVS